MSVHETGNRSAINELAFGGEMFGGNDMVNGCGSTALRRLFSAKERVFEPEMWPLA